MDKRYSNESSRQINGREKIKRVAEGENPTVIGIPHVVGVVVVRVQPEIIVITLDVENVRIAIGNEQGVIIGHCPLEYSNVLYFILDVKVQKHLAPSIFIFHKNTKEAPEKKLALFCSAFSCFRQNRLQP
ncbi:hypothetical protein KKC83_04480 [Patescibacteria group bacterium]|nr:hypothetical protein [Candidatus Falkowbacteria bacterium]MBU3906382.1 hypothetical protein [Patescibacteria group bacterium]MBU4015456.1 hypothetical protein [Patescibacteria group bacterium]MBU4026772.1 hypothetical protein [Patescibacteria group bacterium]MBU4072566.1 hypothetical protein [Patescibacteria group bacterium]